MCVLTYEGNLEKKFDWKIHFRKGKMTCIILATSEGVLVLTFLSKSEWKLLSQLSNLFIFLFLIWFSHHSRIMSKEPIKCSLHFTIYLYHLITFLACRTLYDSGTSIRKQDYLTLEIPKPHYRRFSHVYSMFISCNKMFKPLENYSTIINHQKNVYRVVHFLCTANGNQGTQI